MAENGGTQIAIGKGYRVTWTKSHIIKHAAILSQGDFAFGAAVKIVENDSGEPPLCYAPQIKNIDDMRRVDGRHADRLHRVFGAEIIKPQFRRFSILRAWPRWLCYSATRIRVGQRVCNCGYFHFGDRCIPKA